MSSSTEPAVPPRRDALGRAALVLAVALAALVVVQTVWSAVAPRLLTMPVELGEGTFDARSSDPGAVAATLLALAVVRVILAVVTLAVGIVALRRPGVAKGSAGAATGVASLALVQAAAGFVAGALASV
ncbi:hypothetical protein [Homoserinibacter sp. YIM 151385]|uniref:hypothetical protein n=1 Tax=Homoserinibacter sp. YIM 151385 TaxID=2985506 RepID=UPI0022EFDCF4|nr:hypothetical protein [Homoserinibacter sp. YIM 151385]WBU39275.1 hypothetical protein OF852_06785 [Homoserinibacter sp. YIM 151385]